MVAKEPKDNDPTVEEEALDYDGTRTDQLDDTYRMRVVTASEGGQAPVDGDRQGGDLSEPTTETNGPPVDTAGNEPPTVDKFFGYNPYNAIVETEPQKSSDASERKAKPR